MLAKQKSSCSWKRTPGSYTPALGGHSAKAICPDSVNKYKNGGNSTVRSSLSVIPSDIESDHRVRLHNPSVMFSSGQVNYT